jgi:ADP-heptose:LPS heptosyltransferase
MRALHKIWFILFVMFLRLRHWKRVIVLERTSGLGDVINCTSIYQALKQKYPGHLILYATAEPYADLLRHFPEVDAVYGIPSGGDILKKKAAWLVDRHYEPHSSDERCQKGQKLHVIHVFLKDCNLPVEDWQPRISISAEEKETVARKFRFQPSEILIAIHTGRTWPVKELPEERWQEIVDGLQNKLPCRILHFCSPTRDYGAVHTLQRVQTMPPDLPVTTTVAILSQCRLFIGIDSGLLHMAGAVGIPVIGIFGPTDPRYFLPLNPLAQGISNALPCSFCHHETIIKHWQTGCPFDIRCMKDISAAEVIRVASSVLFKTG